MLVGAGRGGRTPTTLRSADFESAASASSAIPALHGKCQCKLPFSIRTTGVHRTGDRVPAPPVYSLSEYNPHEQVQFARMSPSHIYDSNVLEEVGGSMGSPWLEAFSVSHKR